MPLLESEIRSEVPDGDVVIFTRALRHAVGVGRRRSDAVRVPGLTVHLSRLAPSNLERLVARRGHGHASWRAEPRSSRA